MTHVFHRHLRQAYPVAVAGEGPYLIDRDGKRYLDGSGGAAVSCLGHGHPAVVAAVAEQVKKLEYAHTSFFTSEPAEALADDLVAHAPEGIDHVYFVSGGSEGVEAALKMAVQYFHETGRPQKNRVIARWQSYHGNTLGALSAGGNRWRRAQFPSLLLEQIEHIGECYEYRGRREGETSDQYGRRMADELEAAILRLGPDHVAAFIAEPVVGATLGADSRYGCARVIDSLISSSPMIRPCSVSIRNIRPGWSRPFCFTRSGAMSRTPASDAMTTMSSWVT